MTETAETTDTAQLTGHALEVSSLPQTWDELEAWLDAIPAVPRARLLALIVDGKNHKRLAEKRRAAVTEASNDHGSAREIADQLGTSVHAVYKTRRARNRTTSAAEHPQPPG